MSTVLIFIFVIIGIVVFSFVKDSITETDKIVKEGGIYNKLLLSGKSWDVPKEG